MFGMSSATVFFDVRKNKLRLDYRLRVKCLACCGAGTNRLICSHEKKCVELARGNESVARNVLS